MVLHPNSLDPVLKALLLPPEDLPGFVEVTLDAKGRFKLPECVAEHWAPRRDYFATTLDGSTGLIIPKPLWNHNILVLSQLEDDGPKANRIRAAIKLAKIHGVPVTLGDHSRLVIPGKLKETLALSPGPLRLEYHQGAVKFYSQTAFDRMRLEIEKSLSEQDFSLLKDLVL
jgi:DNA-binding transcriptional regulator/RsmH inhibitor MraZ